MKEVDTRKVNENLVGMLETMLELAKSGEMISAAVAGVMHNAGTVCVHSCHDYPTVVVGELAVLQREVMDAYITLDRKPLVSSFTDLIISFISLALDHFLSSCMYSTSL